MNLRLESLKLLMVKLYKVDKYATAYQFLQDLSYGNQNCRWDQNNKTRLCIHFFLILPQKLSSSFNFKMFVLVKTKS